MSKKTYTVQPELSSTRLDIFLLLNNNEFSRNFLSTAIKKGFVNINNKAAEKSSYKVKEGDVISFDEEEIRKNILENDFENVKAVSIPLNIVFEDDDVLVINKESGIPTHPSFGHVENTLLNGVHAYLHYDKDAIVHARKHMVHRLDKDTSGLIIFAKTDKMLWWLHRQFAERNVKKYYYAFSFTPKKNQTNELITVEGYLERSRRERKQYLFSNKYGKWSKTEFVALKNYKASYDNQNFTLYQCMPKTGRTHQIRVHLKHVNAPIWGDPIYDSEKQLRFSKNFSNKNNIIDRLFLHAYKLSFSSYNGKKYEIEIPLNKDLEKILSKFNEY